MAAPFQMVALPPLRILCDGSPSLTHGCKESPAMAIHIASMTCHEWLANEEGRWLNQNNAQIGLSRLNPLSTKCFLTNRLAKRPVKAKLGVRHRNQVFFNPKHRTSKYSSKVLATRVTPPKSWS